MFTQETNELKNFKNSAKKIIKFLYFTEKEKNGEEFGSFEKVLFEKYKVKKIGTFYRLERNRSMVELYELEKIGE